jgi:hypothetical protein
MCRNKDWNTLLNDKSWMQDKAVLTQMIQTLYEDEPDDSLDEFTALRVSGDKTIDETEQQIISHRKLTSVLYNEILYISKYSHSFNELQEHFHWLMHRLTKTRTNKSRR